MVEACIPNIGPRERAKRLRYGIVFAVIGLAAAAALIATGTPRIFRMVLFAPFFVSGTGVFQALEKT
jgi:hypothetical protein